MSPGDIISLIAALLTALGMAAAIIGFFVRLSLAPMRETMTALDRSVRDDLAQLSERVVRHDGRIDQLHDRVVHLEADKVSHGRLEAVLGRHPGP